MNVQTTLGFAAACVPAEVFIGPDETVTIHKDYGPTAFVDVRITPRIDTCEWVVEQQDVDTNEWSEVARFPGQPWVEE